SSSGYGRAFLAAVLPGRIRPGVGAGAAVAFALLRQHRWRQRRAPPGRLAAAVITHCPARRLWRNFAAYFPVGLAPVSGRCQPWTWLAGGVGPVANGAQSVACG
ncbi:hypothetical protein DC030_15320, partial [Enterococcus faecalis]